MYTVSAWSQHPSKLLFCISKSVPSQISSRSQQMSFQLSLSFTFRWLRVKQLSHYDWRCTHANRRSGHFVFSAGPLALHQAPHQEVYLRAASPRWVPYLRSLHTSCFHFPSRSPLLLSCVRQTGLDADESCLKKKVCVQQCSSKIRFQIWYFSVQSRNAD